MRFIPNIQSCPFGAKVNAVISKMGIKSNACRKIVGKDEISPDHHHWAGFKLPTYPSGASFSKILSPIVILSREKAMVTKVISELKSVSRLKILPETGP